MNKYKAILHIGTEKTGTSTLQEFFHINREVLSQLGIFYPKVPGNRDHRKLSAYASETRDDFHRRNKIYTLEDQRTFEKAFEKAFCEELGTHSSHDRLLLSSEHFHSRLLNESELVKLKRLLDPYVKEYKIIVYLRAQIDMVTSLYSTKLKSGNKVGTLKKFIKKTCHPGNRYFNYQDLLQRWADLFGEENMIVRLYDPKEFKEGSLIEDLLDTIDLRDSPVTFQLPKNKNSSLSPTGQKTYRILNIFIKRFNLRDTLAHKIIRRIINRFFVGKGEKPDIMFAKQIQAQFDSSNHEVQKRWFPERELLFDINWGKYPNIK